MCQRLPPPPATARTRPEKSPPNCARSSRVVGACPPSRPAALNRHRAVSAPPCCPPLSLSRLPCTEEARSHRPEVVGIRRPPLRADNHLRAANDSDFPRCELCRAPLFLPMQLFRVSWLLAPNPRAPSTSLPPAMAATSPAAFPGRALGLGEFPFTPATPRCPRLFEPWPLAPVPSSPACSLPPAMAEPRRRHCSGRPPSSLPPLIKSNPFILNPTAENIRYPFVGQIAKEPSCFRVNEPAVPSVVSRVRFLVLKT